MAVTANLTYKGVSLTGITFTVVNATHQETDTVSELAYRCTVKMPDGSYQGDTGWENIIDESPNFTKSPLADAEDKMVARLTAIGATNIQTVGE